MQLFLLLQLLATSPCSCYSSGHVGRELPHTQVIEPGLVFGSGFETVQYDDPLAPVSPQGVCYHSSDSSLCFGSNTDSGLSEPPCGSNLFISLMHVASVEVPLFTGYLHCCCTLKRYCGKSIKSW